MIDLIKGNLDNLEGRVFVYSQLQAEPYPNTRSHGELIIALYGASNFDLIFRKMAEIGVYFGDGPVFIKNCLGDILRDVKIPTVDLTFASTPIPAESKEHILLHSQGDDVMFIGQYSSPAVCIRAINAGFDLYALKFYNQSLKKRILEKESGYIHSPIQEQKEKTPIITHQTFADKPIDQEILRRYVIPMLDAVIQKEFSAFEALKNDFLMFSLDSLFSDHVWKLCGIIKEGVGKPNIPLIEAYVAHINHIHKEDYTSAAITYDKISDLTRHMPV